MVLHQHESIISEVQGPILYIFKCNDWDVQSAAHVEVDVGNKIIYLRGSQQDKDFILDKTDFYPSKEIEEMFHDIIAALKCVRLKKDYNRN
jgi:hypothetical protein